MHRSLRLSLATLAGVVFLGCGSSNDTGDGSGTAHSKDGGNGSSSSGNDAASGATGADGGLLPNIGAGGSTGSGAGGSSASNAGGADGGGSAAAPGAGGTVTSVTPITPANACVSDKSQATGDLLDIFIMQDRSQSMTQVTASGSSKWTVITTALGAFVSDPKSAGIGAGIGFFSIDDAGGNLDCTAADYAKPAVGIAPLNGNAAAIKTAIKGVQPGGNTPTEPALQGALTYAQTWAKAHPTHKVIVVFATDGLPNGCNSTVAGAAAIAKKMDSGANPVPTYVVGVFGSKDCPNGLGQTCTVVQNTNSIAKGGGTGSAFIVDTGGSTEAQFEAAMNAIRTANAASCDYTIPLPPAGKVIDASHAAVQYTTGTAKPVNLTWVANQAACTAATGGWYYNSVTSPQKIHLCATTCTKIQSDPTAKLNVILACDAASPPGSGGNGGTSGGGGGGGTAGGGNGTGAAGGVSGAGGTAGGTGSGGTPACLLIGQSCSSGSECCSGLCSAQVCAVLH